MPATPALALQDDTGFGAAPAAVDPAQAEADRDNEPDVFFKITHAAVGQHKMLFKGSVSAHDIGIQQLPVRHRTDAQVCLSLDAGSMPPAGLATWMKNPRISYDSLAKGLKQWTIVQKKMFHVDELKLRDALPASAITDGAVEGDGALVAFTCTLASCLQANAFGDSKHVYVPSAEEMPSVQGLVKAQLMVCVAPGQFRLSKHGAALVARQMVLWVERPFLFFSSRESVCLEDCSVLELLQELDQAGWAKVTDAKRTRKLQPYESLNPEAVKKFYVVSKQVPFSLYLVLLLTATERGISTVYHCQCQAYYKALDDMNGHSSVIPHQTSQFYRALLTRFRKGGTGTYLGEQEAPRNLRVDDSDGFGEHSAPAEPSSSSRRGNAPSGPRGRQSRESDELLQLQDVSDGGETDGASPAYISSGEESEDKGDSAGRDAGDAFASVAAAVLPRPPSMPPGVRGPRLKQADGAHEHRQEPPSAPDTAAGSALAGAKKAPAPPRRSRRDHPNSFQHGPFFIAYRSDKHGESYQAECPFHTKAGLCRCSRDTRTNQPDADTVKLRLMAWCNAAARWPLTDIAAASDLEILSARAGCLALNRQCVCVRERERVCVCVCIPGVVVATNRQAATM